MAVDVSTLTIDNITPEIMSQMGPSEIEAFKAKLTPEQFQSLADKFGGSQVAPPEDGVAPKEVAKTSFVVDPATIPELNLDSGSSGSSGSSGNPTEQKGPFTFGRK